MGRNQAPQAAPILLTARQVAKILLVNTDTVYRLSRLGRLPKPVVIGGSRYRWRQDQIDQLLQVA